MSGQTECWNGYCIAGDCDGESHVDCTGDTWSQRRGTEYNPASGRYDLPRGSNRYVVSLDDRDDFRA